MGDHSAQTATSALRAVGHFLRTTGRQEPGIIGDNSAGKSTLLKLLVGTLQPSGGAVQLNGQVAALLELGTGFHPEFTGRHNIYLNAPAEGADDNIAELEKDIIDFSGLDYFIDRPVKTYSSGMYVRLAFFIATGEAGYLVIDEALSVGDMAFSAQVRQRMNQFRAEQKTMVFCSRLCSTFKSSAPPSGSTRVRSGRWATGQGSLTTRFRNNKKSYNTIV